MRECFRSWSWSSKAWCNLRIVISPGGLIGVVELDLGADMETQDKFKFWQLLRYWIAATLRSPDFIPTTVRRLWLINLPLNRRVDVTVEPTP